MRVAGFLWLLLLLVLWSSCRTDFDTVPSNGGLEFSKDTVFLDTVFSNIGSSTYNLKVFNRTSEDITIPDIRLALGNDSRYRLNVDGLAGKEFRETDIPARDSIFIFVETTVNIEDLATEAHPFLYTDAIEFDSGANLQQVPLVTLVQDAVFLYPQKDDQGMTETLVLGTSEEGTETRLEGFFLEEHELLFTRDKPYVIYGYAAVPPGQTLTIEAGARIHFHSGSGILVSDKASLQVMGSLSEDRTLLENEVIFQGDRLESRFSKIPGQWGVIWLREGSVNNRIDHATIRNGTIGLLVDGNAGDHTAPLLLKNTQIYNSAASGLLARNGHIDAENLVINNSGQASLHLSLGGRYRFKHATLTNYWQNGYRAFPAVYIENELVTSTRTYVSDLEEASFSNCIIYGNQDLELFFNRNGAAAFNFRMENTLLKFRDPTDELVQDALYQFEEEIHYKGMILNEDPGFQDPQQHLLVPGASSAARNAGNLETASEVPLDIRGIDRTQEPDLGAYQGEEIGPDDSPL